VHQFLEAAGIALQAIWSNKLRSLLTVLGNIVAVTSIIAVVSLVQGLNASVEDMIQSQFAADAFTVVRTGITFTEEEQIRAQRNPRVTMADAAAIRAVGSTIGMVMAEIGSSAAVRYRATKVDSVQIRGVTKEYNNIPSTQIELGRPITPGEFDTGRNVAVLGWDTADTLFGQVSPLDKTFTLAGVHFLVVGVAPQ
jgi:putative ABC transport system permease protein